MLLKRVCLHCAKEFVRDICPSTAKYGKFCSTHCFFAHRDGTAIDRFWNHVKKSDGCWTWTGRATSNGYGSLSIQDRTIYAHRFSYELHYGPIPKGRFVCHHCDNPPCVRPDHLYAGTVKDNARDAWARGLSKPGPPKRGSSNGFARLTEAKVLQIRAMAKHMIYKDIASRFGVDTTTVGLIVRRKTWAHI